MEDLKRYIQKGGTPFRIGATVLMLLVVCSMFSGAVSDSGGMNTRIQNRLSPPSISNPFGCDESGEGVAGLLLKGARVALMVGVATVAISLVVGVSVGAAAGYFGGATDTLIARIMDILMAFPGILLAMGIIAVTRNPSYLSVVAALSATGWVGYARVARAQVKTIRNQDFVSAARVMGASPSRIIATHLIPNIASPMIVQATFGIASAILAEASLSFLGLGPQHSPSWGALMDQGTQYMVIRWHLALFPGIALFCTVLGINLLGDGIRDIIDTKRGFGGGGR